MVSRLGREVYGGYRNAPLLGPAPTREVQGWSGGTSWGGVESGGAGFWGGGVRGGTGDRVIGGRG